MTNERAPIIDPATGETVPDTFFLPDGDHFVPTAWTRSGWDPNAMRGGAISGLLMHEVARRHLDPAFQVSRLTVDMFRLAPMVPVTVRTSMAREGGRIMVADAVLVADEQEIARASVVMLRRTEAPEGEVWSPPNWDVPHPDTLPPTSWAGERLPIWERRYISGDPAANPVPAPKRAWLHDSASCFVGDEAASPVVRAAMICDSANPFANLGTRGLNYVNADASLYMHRYPVGEWTGIEVIAHHSSEGIAVGECALYDLQGAFGRTTVCAVANRRRSS